MSIISIYNICRKIHSFGGSFQKKNQHFGIEKFATLEWVEWGTLYQIADLQQQIIVDWTIY